jgi:hypothetical protein
MYLNLLIWLPSYERALALALALALAIQKQAAEQR